MFESVTKKRKNPIVNAFGWGLIILVCLVFVFMGFSPDSSFLGRGGAAAEVNGEVISLREYREVVERMESQADSSDRDSRQKAQSNAINLLISRALIVQEAENLDVYVSDKEVAGELMKIEPFFEDGQFSRVRYKTYLRQMRMTEADFEDRLRRDLIIQKMNQLVAFTVKDVPMVDDFDKKIEQAQMNIAYIKIQPQEFSSLYPVKSKAVAEYMSANDGQLKEYFEQHQAQFQRPEEVKARHILIKADQEGDKAQAEAKAKQMAKTLSAKNFKQVATLHSDDPGSKSKGGDLGFFTKGRMDPDFESAAFSAQVGKVVGPVETKFGYHFILVEEHRNALTRQYEDVKAEIAQEFLAKQKVEELNQKLNAALAANKSDEVESLVSSNGLQWKTTGFISVTRENVPGMTVGEDFFKTALTLNEAKQYPQALVRQEGSAYLLKFKGAKLDAPVAASGNQMDFFKQFMKQQRAEAILSSYADSLKEQASIKINPEVVTN